jgi:hypothetical protein
MYDLDVYERIILKYMLEKGGGGVDMIHLASGGLL